MLISIMFCINWLWYLLEINRRNRLLYYKKINVEVCSCHNDNNTKNDDANNNNDNNNNDNNDNNCGNNSNNMKDKYDSH